MKVLYWLCAAVAAVCLVCTIVSALVLVFQVVAILAAIIGVSWLMIYIGQAISNFKNKPSE